jgi:DnaK suppressor protein
MNTETMEFGSLLQQHLGQLRAALDVGQRGSVACDADASRPGRLSRMESLLREAVKNGSSETLLREQRRLEAALVRFKEGTFGACCQCGISITGEHLHTDPGAPFCPPCQEAIEERRPRARR